MDRRATIKNQILEITEDYLGPAAERFIDRQINTHLHKSPEKLTKNDITELADWLRLSFTVLTDDNSLIEDYIKRLKRIAQG